MIRGRWRSLGHRGTVISTKLDQRWMNQRILTNCPRISLIWSIWCSLLLQLWCYSNIVTILGAHGRRQTTILTRKPRSGTLIMKPLRVYAHHQKGSLASKTTAELQNAARWTISYYDSWFMTPNQPFIDIYRRINPTKQPSNQHLRIPAATQPAPTHPAGLSDHCCRPKQITAVAESRRGSGMPPAYQRGTQNNHRQRLHDINVL